MGFQKAVKETFTLKLGIAGIAGVGKSLTSFQIARELACGERFAVIDTENKKARKYADEFQFDVSDLEMFSLSAYTKEIRLAEQSGYKVLVIDGLSQLWEGKGGIKEMVEMIAKRDRISTFTAWQQGNALLADFVKLILESPLHIICTMRSKPDYSTSNESGKPQYKRTGLAPVFKDNLEFEFDLFAEMDSEHHMIFQKSLCRNLSGKVLPMVEEDSARKLAAILKKWMAGAPVPAKEEKQPGFQSAQASGGQRAQERQSTEAEADDNHAPADRPAQSANTEKPKPAYYDVYQAGKEKNLWQGIKGFCEFAAEKLGTPVTPENVANLAKPRLDQLMAEVTGQDPMIKQKESAAV